MVSQRTNPTRDQVSPEDWLSLAEDEIAEDGFSGVRILSMAKKLSVSRSSFYWHFRDRQELVHTFVRRWRQRQLDELQGYQPHGGSVEAEIRRVLTLMISDTDITAREISIGLAVRGLARHDPFVASIVEEVDAARFAYNEQALNLIGTAKRGVDDMAMLLYAATTGARVLTLYPGRNRDRARWLERLVGDLMIQWYRRGGGEILSDSR